MSEIIQGNKKDNRSLEQRNIKLQQRVYDLKWSMFTAIELIEKNNLGKAIKILKRSVYEK